MLRTNMRQNDRIPAPIAGHNDRAESIGKLVNIAATIIAFRYWLSRIRSSAVARYLK